MENKMIIDSFTFEILCAEHLIDPRIALENANLVKAIKENNYDKVIELLENEF